MHKIDLTIVIVKKYIFNKFYPFFDYLYVIEIKPENQTKMESVGRNRYNQAQLIINQAKWKSARLWCKNRGFSFKVINEADIFHTGNKR